MALRAGNDGNKILEPLLFGAADEVDWGLLELSRVDVENGDWGCV